MVALIVTVAPIVSNTSEVALAATPVPVYAPLNVPLLVDAGPVPVKASVFLEYDVVAVFISAVEPIVDARSVKSRPRPALDVRVDAASGDVRSRPSAPESSREIAEVKSSPSAADDEGSVEVCCVLTAVVVCRTEYAPPSEFTRALDPPMVAVDAGLVTIVVVLTALVPVVNAPNAPRNASVAARICSRASSSDRRSDDDGWTFTVIPPIGRFGTPVRPTDGYPVR